MSTEKVLEDMDQVSHAKNVSVSTLTKPSDINGSDAENKFNESNKKIGEKKNFNGNIRCVETPKKVAKPNGEEFGVMIKKYDVGKEEKKDGKKVVKEEEKEKEKAEVDTKSEEGKLISECGVDVDVNDFEDNVKKAVPEVIEIGSPLIDDILELNVSQEDINLLSAGVDFVNCDDYEEGEVISIDKYKDCIIKTTKDDGMKKNAENTNFEKNMEKQIIDHKETKIDNIIKHENSIRFTKITEKYSSFFQTGINMKKNKKIHDTKRSEDNENRSPRVGENKETSRMKSKISKFSYKNIVKTTNKPKLLIREAVDKVPLSVGAKKYSNVSDGDIGTRQGFAKTAKEGKSTDKREAPNASTKIVCIDLDGEVNCKNDVHVDVDKTNLENIVTIDLIDLVDKVKNDEADKTSKKQVVEKTADQMIPESAKTEKDADIISTENKGVFTPQLTIVDTSVHEVILNNLSNDKTLRKVPDDLEREIIRVARDANCFTKLRNFQLNEGEIKVFDNANQIVSVKKVQSRCDLSINPKTEAAMELKAKGILKNTKTISNTAPVNVDDEFKKLMFNKDIDKTDEPLPYYEPYESEWIFDSPMQAPYRLGHPDQSISTRPYRKEFKLKTVGEKDKSYIRRPKPYDRPNTAITQKEHEKKNIYDPSQPYCRLTAKTQEPHHVTALYKESGRLRRNGAVFCNCGNESCIGCWYNCFECESPKLDTSFPSDEVFPGCSKYAHHQ